MTNTSRNEPAICIAETDGEIRACARVLRDRLDEDEIARTGSILLRASR